MLAVVLATLATFRVARMLAQEDGPFDAFTWGRYRIGQGHWLGRGLHCILCLSFWLAAPAAWLVGFSDWQTGVLLWLGIAGGVTLIHETLLRLQTRR